MIDWTPAKENRLTELFTDDEGYSETTIAKMMSDEFNEQFSRDAVHNKMHRLENRTALLDKPRPEMPYFAKYEEFIKGDGVDKVFEFEGSFVEMPADRLKILHLGDLHIPFQIDEQIQEAVNKNRTADVAVTVEVSDCYSVSRFSKNLSVPLEVEIDYILRYFEFMDETFPLTLVLSGNHQKRIAKEMVNNLHPSLLFLVDGDLMTKLAKPFKRVVVCKTPILQINDALFTHAEAFSKVDLKAAVNVYNIMTEWKDVLGLKPYTCIIQSHTHMLGSTYRGGHMKIMETGCLCYVPDYAVNRLYSKPQTNGYIVVQQKDGVTDFNLTREYTFGSPPYTPGFNPAGGYGLGI